MTKKGSVVIIGAGAIIALATIIYAIQAEQPQPTVPTFAPSEKETSSIESQSSLTPAMAADADGMEVWEQLGLPHDPNEGETEEANQAILEEDQRSKAIEEERARIDAKEGEVFALVVSDERVKAEIEGTHEVTSDFLPSERRVNSDADLMTLLVTGREVLTGSWETSYKSVLTERFSLTIEVKDGSIISIEKKTLEDLGGVFTYTDEEKELIRTALQDSNVQSAVKQKEDAGLGLAVSLRPIANPTMDCPAEGCWLIVIRQVDSHATFLVWLNSTEDKVIKAKAMEGW